MKSNENWRKSVEANTDPYGAAVIRYAEEWANAIEAALASGKTVAQVAEQCEPKGHGITGFMYGAAVASLADGWEHGDELRRWHNRNYGAPDDAKGTVNPAILTFSTGGDE